MEKLTIEEQIQVVEMLAKNGIKIEEIERLNLKIQDFPLATRKNLSKILINNGNDFSKLLSSGLIALDELTENEIAMLQGYGARNKFWERTINEPEQQDR